MCDKCLPSVYLSSFSPLYEPGRSQGFFLVKGHFFFFTLLLLVKPRVSVQVIIRVIDAVFNEKVKERDLSLVLAAEAGLRVWVLTLKQDVSVAVALAHDLCPGRRLTQPACSQSMKTWVRHPFLFKKRWLFTFAHAWTDVLQGNSQEIACFYFSSNSC